MLNTSQSGNDQPLLVGHNIDDAHLYDSGVYLSPEEVQKKIQQALIQTAIAMA